MPPRRTFRLLVLALCAAMAAPAGARSASGPVPLSDVDALRSMHARAGDLRLRFGVGTGAFRAVIAEPGRTLAPRASGGPVEAARAFLATYGAPFGLAGNDARSSLVVLRTETDRAGGAHIVMQQRHRDVLVDGARLTVHMEGSGITGVTGVFVPELALDTRPTLHASEAASIAAALVPGARAESPVLVIHRSGLAVDEPGRSTLAYRVDVRLDAIGERAWIDAHTGVIIERTPLHRDARERLVFAGASTIDQAAVRKEGDPPTGVSALDTVYDFSGHTYDLFARAFGRDAFDGNGSPMRTVSPAAGLCPNAWWNGTAAHFCPGFDTDDVVAHEFAHGYTEHAHDLVYSCEPGALNESYSDIWGETVDLINGADGIGGSNNAQPATLGQRWLIGEDIPNRIYGTIRDMWRPQRFGQPAKASSIGNRCAEVHTNSGVPNHAYSLLVDGGTYNNVTLTGIGLTKAANIYYLAMIAYQHPNTRFSEHALALRAACDVLVGAPLVDIATGAPSPAITANDCTQVDSAIDAVELNLWLAGAITGRVTRAGAPVTGACIEAFDTSQSLVSATRSTANGSYRITELPAGTYRLRLTDCAGTGRVQWHSGKGSFATADEITVAANEHVQGIDFTLGSSAVDVSATSISVVDDPNDPRGTHTVTVVGANAAPVAAEQVVVTVTACPESAGACTSAFKFMDVPASGSASVTFVWRTTGWTGSALIDARLEAIGDVSEGNDTVETTHTIGPGPVGVGILSSWE